MTVFDEMVAELGPQTSIDKTNAQHEVMQQIALSGLQRGGFFEHAAFYGGTCLRIFHGLRRFSEDMDFTLTEKNLNVHLEDYFPDIIEAFKLTGREVEIKKKDSGIQPGGGYFRARATTGSSHRFSRGSVTCMQAPVRRA